MSFLIVFMAISILVIIVLSVVAIVMSTSKGADLSESVWKSRTGRSSLPHHPEGVHDNDSAQE